MDFFASQDLARRKTKWLVFYFFAAVICMIVGIYVVVILVFGFAGGAGVDQPGGTGNFTENLTWFDPIIFAIVAVSVMMIVGSGSLFKIAALRGGGDAVAAMLGGRKLPPNSRDAEERRILNVVEEVALAAGTPVPPVYVLDKEDGINAFAAGYTIDDAVIGVNRGTIHQLNRDELQGVIAHEFSHILNGDMRMSIRMIGVLHGIQLLALIGFYILRGAAWSGGGRSSKDGKGAGAILLVAVGVIVIGSIGLFFARLIKASVSRQREYLADASAVQFTRNPDGIAGALKMIGASQYGSEMKTPQAEEASHMFFASMFGKSMAGLFATHPPLVPRIQRVDPRFDGDFSEYVKTRESRLRKREKKEQAKQKRAELRFPKTPGQRILPAEIADRFPIDPVILLAGIGLPNDNDVEYSQLVMHQLSENLREAARDLFSARCIVFASLLDSDKSIQSTQLEMIRASQGGATVQETLKLLPEIETIDPRFCLPLFEILQGTLSGMSNDQYQSFHQLIDQLVHADRRVDLFEFFLRHHLIMHLDRRFGKAGVGGQIKYRAIGPLSDDIRRLLAVLVHIGHSEESSAQAAFDAAMQSAGLDSVPHRLAMGAEDDFASLAESLTRLSQASHPIKKRTLAAAAIAITFDQQVTVEEAEMFRAMSESLDCPVPPVVASPEQKMHYIG